MYIKRVNVISHPRVLTFAFISNGLIFLSSYNYYKANNVFTIIFNSVISCSVNAKCIDILRSQ